MIKRLLILLLLSTLSIPHFAQTYISKDNYTGDYNDASTWIGDQPPSNGNIIRNVEFNGTVNRTGNIDVRNGILQGILNLTGRFRVMYGNTFVLKSGSLLEVDGDFYSSGNITIEDNAKLIVHGNFDHHHGYKCIMKTGAEIIVDKDLLVTGILEMENNSKLTVQGNYKNYLYKATYDGDIIVEGKLEMWGADFGDNSNLVYKGDSIHMHNSDLGNAKIFVNDGVEIKKYGEDDINEKNIEDLKLEDEELYEYVLDVISIYNGYDWIGNNDNWFDGSNWSTEKAPNEKVSVYIKKIGNDKVYPILESNITLRNLYIEDQASLKITNGAHVTLRNLSISDNGELIVENTNDKPVSLKVILQSKGNVTFRNEYQNSRYWYIGHPIVNPSIQSYKNLWENNNQFIFRYYDHGYHRVTNNVDILKESLNGCQLNIRYSTGNIVELKGELNNEEYYSKELIDGWQLIANPYSCYYDIRGASDDFINTTGSIWIRSNGIAYTYNLSTGQSIPEGEMDGIIAPGQSFWVKREIEGMIDILKSNRIHAGSVLKNMNIVNQNQIRIKLSSDDKQDEILVMFHEMGSNKLTRADSEKFNKTSENDIYLYTQKSDVKVAINTFPLGSMTRSIPLYFDSSSKRYKLSMNGTGSLTGYDEVILEDKVLGQKMLMTDDFEYEFDANDRVSNDRFIIHLKKNEIVTDIEEVNDQQVKVILEDDSVLKIDINGHNGRKLVCLYSLNGQLVKNVEFDKDEYRMNISDLAKGLYIVEVKYDSQVYNEKILLK